VVVVLVLAVHYGQTAIVAYVGVVKIIALSDLYTANVAGVISVLVNGAGRAFTLAYIAGVVAVGVLAFADDGIAHVASVVAGYIKAF
jgi:hypothetical protein